MSAQQIANVTQYSLSALMAAQEMLENNRSGEEIVGMLMSTLSTTIMSLEQMYSLEDCHGSPGAEWVKKNHLSLRKVYKNCFATHPPDVDFIVASILEGSLVFDNEGNISSEKPVVYEESIPTMLQ